MLNKEEELGKSMRQIPVMLKIKGCTQLEISCRDLCESMWSNMYVS